MFFQAVLVPLPPPAALAHFDHIIPLGAERIMSMIEREQAHRILHDEAFLRSAGGDIKRGHWIGAAIRISNKRRYLHQ